MNYCNGCRRERVKKNKKVICIVIMIVLSISMIIETQSIYGMNTKDEGKTVPCEYKSDLIVNKPNKKIETNKFKKGSDESESNLTEDNCQAEKMEEKSNNSKINNDNRNKNELNNVDGNLDIPKRTLETPVEELSKGDEEVSKCEVKTEEDKIHSDELLGTNNQDIKNIIKTKNDKEEKYSLETDIKKESDNNTKDAKVTSKNQQNLLNEKILKKKRVVASDVINIEKNNKTNKSTTVKKVIPSKSKVLPVRKIKKENLDETKEIPVKNSNVINEVNNKKNKLKIVEDNRIEERKPLILNELVISRNGKPFNLIRVNELIENVSLEKMNEIGLISKETELLTDGIYKVSLVEKDINNRKIKRKKPITFRIDNTEPEITAVDIVENNNADNVKLNFEVFDNMEIEELDVYVNNRLIKNVKVFKKDPNKYRGNVILDKKIGVQKIKFVALDTKGNKRVMTSEYRPESNKITILKSGNKIGNNKNRNDLNVNKNIDIAKRGSIINSKKVGSFISNFWILYKMLMVTGILGILGFLVSCYKQRGGVV